MNRQHLGAAIVAGTVCAFPGAAGVACGAEEGGWHPLTTV